MSLKAENERLRLKLSKVNKTLRRLRKKISQLKKDFRNWPLTLWDLTGNTVIIKASHKQKTETFEIKVADVVCILADGKTKSIYLREPIQNMNDESRKTDVITRDDGMKSLMELIDPMNRHLQKVSKSSIVNVEYYALSKNVLQLNIREYKTPKCKQINVNKPYLKKFQQKKQTLEILLRSQKGLVHSFD